MVGLWIRILASDILKYVLKVSYAHQGCMYLPNMSFIPVISLLLCAKTHHVQKWKWESDVNRASIYKSKALN